MNLAWLSNITWRRIKMKKDSEKEIKILVVEDDKKELRNVKMFLEQIVNSGVNLNVIYSSKLTSLILDKIKQKEFDGVMTDVFFPIEEKYRKDIIEEVQNSSWTYEIMKIGSLESKEKKLINVIKHYSTDTCPPAGVLIARDSLESNIPVVYVTNTYHHGLKTQPIFGWGCDRNVPVFDCEENESGKKWKEAYFGLMYFIEELKSKQIKFIKIEKITRFLDNRLIDYPIVAQTLNWYNEEIMKTKDHWTLWVQAFYCFSDKRREIIKKYGPGFEN